MSEDLTRSLELSVNRCQLYTFVGLRPRFVGVRMERRGQAE